MNKLKMTWPSKKVFLSVSIYFLIAHIAHFFLLILSEYLLARSGREFFFDWYSVLMGFSIGLEFNAFLAGILIFLSIVFLGRFASKWSELGRILCVLIPLGPTVDLVLHLTQIQEYKPYRNLFSVEYSALERFYGFVIPSFSESVFHITWGHRFLFVLISLMSAAFVFKVTREWLRAGGMLVLSYLSICSVLAFLSPSDLPPTEIFRNTLLLPILMWAGNVFLIGRCGFISTQVLRVSP